MRHQCDEIARRGEVELLFVHALFFAVWTTLQCSFNKEALKEMDRDQGETSVAHIRALIIRTIRTGFRFSRRASSKLIRAAREYFRTGNNLTCGIPGCNGGYAIKHELEDHFVTQHFGSRFICHFPNCNRDFAQQRTFNSHRASAGYIDANEITGAVFVGNEVFNQIVVILQQINTSLFVLSNNVRYPAWMFDTLNWQFFLLGRSDEIGRYRGTYWETSLSVKIQKFEFEILRTTP